MNIFKKCSICGEPFKLSRHGGEMLLDDHLEKVHPKEYQEMKKLQQNYSDEVDKLDTLYDARRVTVWFKSATKEEWEKTQPVKPRPMDELLTLMKAGWEIGAYDASWGSPYITTQKGGLGKGGDSKYYSRNTLDALLRRGLIKYVEVKSFPLKAKYVLTEKGKKVERVQ